MESTIFHPDELFLRLLLLHHVAQLRSTVRSCAVIARLQIGARFAAATCHYLEKCCYEQAAKHNFARWMGTRLSKAIGASIDMHYNAQRDLRTDEKQWPGSVSILQ